MCFYYLLAGHLMGDFTLQTNYIAGKKAKETKLVCIHSLIVTISILLFSLPFGDKIIFLSFVNGALHFFIDYLKIKLTSRAPIKSFIYYLADQFCHIIIIYFISLYSSSYNPKALDKNFIFFIISLLFTLSFAGITIQFLLRILCKMNYKSFYFRNEKSIGNMDRIAIFLIIFLSYYYSAFYIAILPLAIIFIVIYYGKKLREWMPVRYFAVRLFLEMLFSSGGFIIFWLLKG